MTTYLRREDTRTLPVMEEINASAAYSRSKNVRTGNISSKAGDTNYTLTMSRLFETIKRESDAGKQQTAFIAPLFVMDGTLADPVLLAKQIKVKLVRLGYEVDRSGDTLHIAWDHHAPAAVVSTGATPCVRLPVRLNRPPLNPPRGYSTSAPTNTKRPALQPARVSVRRVAGK
jgi:hypothetical protein